MLLLDCEEELYFELDCAASEQGLELSQYVLAASVWALSLDLPIRAVVLRKPPLDRREAGAVWEVVRKSEGTTDEERGD